MSETVPAIYGKVNEIRKKIGRIAKNGVGPQTQGSYKFLAIDDILEAVKPLEDEAGVISYPVDHTVTFHYNRATDKGDGRVPKENVQGLVDFVFRYVAVEDGSHIDVSVPGEGIDSQDKAVRKSTTQAQKIANILLYNIITGEQDPDSVDGGADAQGAVQPSRTERQLDRSRQAAPAQRQAKSSSRETIRVDYIEAGKVDKEAVNGRMQYFKDQQGLSGDAVWDAILKELKASEEA